jgi:hypothetical protein
MSNEEKIAKIQQFMAVNQYAKAVPIFNTIIWYLESDDLESAQDKMKFDSNPFWDSPNVVAFLDELNLISDRYKTMLKLWLD